MTGGTLIVPDKIANGLKKDMNALLVRYKPDVNSNEVLKKMIPIGLDKNTRIQIRRKEHNV